MGLVNGYHVTRLCNEQREGTLTRTLKDRDGPQRQTSRSAGRRIRLQDGMHESVIRDWGRHRRDWQRREGTYKSLLRLAPSPYVSKPYMCPYLPWCGNRGFGLRRRVCVRWCDPDWMRCDRERSGASRREGLCHSPPRLTAAVSADHASFFGSSKALFHGLGSLNGGEPDNAHHQDTAWIHCLRSTSTYTGQSKVGNARTNPAEPSRSHAQGRQQQQARSIELGCIP